MQDGVWSNERVAATCHDVLQYRDAGSSCDAPSLLDDPQPLRTSVDRYTQRYLDLAIESVGG